MIPQVGRDLGCVVSVLEPSTKSNRQERMHSNYQLLQLRKTAFSLPIPYQHRGLRVEIEPDTEATGSLVSFERQDRYCLDDGRRKGEKQFGGHPGCSVKPGHILKRYREEIVTCSPTALCTVSANYIYYQWAEFSLLTRSQNSIVTLGVGRGLGGMNAPRLPGSFVSVMIPHVICSESRTICPLARLVHSVTHASPQRPPPDPLLLQSPDILV